MPFIDRSEDGFTFTEVECELCGTRLINNRLERGEFLSHASAVRNANEKGWLVSPEEDSFLCHSCSTTGYDFISEEEEQAGIEDALKHAPDRGRQED